MASHVQVQSTTTDVEEEEEEEEEGGRWSQLPLDLMGTLLKCLSVPDRIRVAAVCEPWRSVTSTLGFLEAARPPWLFVSIVSSLFWSLQTVAGEPVSNIKILDDLQEDWLFGSSKGWLLMKRRDHTLIDPMLVYLLNPITGAKIELFRDSFNVTDGILSASPLTRDYMFAAMGIADNNTGRTVIVRTTMGDYWIMEALQPLAIGFHGGRLYVLTLSWEVIVYELDPDPVMSSTIRIPFRIEYECSLAVKFVESNDDTLILAYGFYRNKNIIIKVFKLPEMADDPVVQVTSFLGGSTLLISHLSEPMLVKGSAFRADCIYGFLTFLTDNMMAYSMKDEHMFEVAGMDIRKQTFTWFTPDLLKMEETSKLETRTMNLEASVIPSSWLS